MDRHGLRPRDDSYLKPTPRLRRGPMPMSLRGGLKVRRGNPPDHLKGTAPLFNFPSSRRLLLLLETNTEASVVVATALVAEALSGARVRPGVVPAATAQNPVRARCRSLGIGHVTRRVSRLVPVRHPFPDIPGHVVKAPRIGGVLADVASLVDSAARVIRLRACDRVTPRVRRGRSRPAGVFPLRLGR